VPLFLTIPRVKDTNLSLPVSYTLFEKNTCFLPLQWRGKCSFTVEGEGESFLYRGGASVPLQWRGKWDR